MEERVVEMLPFFCFANVKLEKDDKKLKIVSKFHYKTILLYFYRSNLKF